MRKVYNFSAGPAMLPEEVLLKAQAELLDWHDSGMSIMELGHRGAQFQEMAAESISDLRELMQIPNNYQILFLTGGATAQFAMIPLNLLTTKKVSNYVDTGIWSKKAIEEAKRYGKVNIVAQTKIIDDLICIPNQDEWQISDEAAYLHYTPNETIQGIEFNWTPKTQLPLVADMSSMILSRPINVADYGLIYAGAQKNIGQAGLTIVIIRDDLISDLPPPIPSLYKYKLHADHQSFYNTPPTYAWYMAGLVFKWLKANGGVQRMHAINKRKASKLYDFIDTHKHFYNNNIHPTARSIMNIVFNLPANKDAQFLEAANRAGLTNLKGHRVVGGMRASIYNAMPEEGVDKLIEFMHDFAKRNA